MTRRRAGGRNGPYSRMSRARSSAWRRRAAAGSGIAVTETPFRIVRPDTAGRAPRCPSACASRRARRERRGRVERARGVSAVQGGGEDPGEKLEREWIAWIVALAQFTFDLASAPSTWPSSRPSRAAPSMAASALASISPVRSGSHPWTPHWKTIRGVSPARRSTQAPSPDSPAPPAPGEAAHPPAPAGSAQEAAPG